MVKKRVGLLILLFVLFTNVVPTSAFANEGYIIAAIGRVLNMHQTSLVRGAQVMLQNHSKTTRDIINSSGGVDGAFGDGTERAVRAYQKANRLQIDGIVGNQTWTSFKNTLIYEGKSGKWMLYKGKLSTSKTCIAKNVTNDCYDCYSSARGWSFFGSR